MKYLPIFTVHFIGMEGRVPILCANFSADPYVRCHAIEDFVLSGLKQYALIRDWSYRDFEEKSRDIIEVVEDYLNSNSSTDKVCCDPLHITFDNEQDSLIVERININGIDKWIHER